MKELRVGSRESRLAVDQTNLVIARIKEYSPELAVSLVTMKTTGDIILDKTLDKIGGKGLFVKELDKALNDKKIDISVHSLKDMPMEIPEQLPLIAFSKREDPRDVLVLPAGCTDWDKNLPIGCSSARRKLQLAALYPELTFKMIRGNVLTRLEKLDRGEYGALVLAASGLKRLGLEARISRYFSVTEMIPAAGQGILAVQGRADMDYTAVRASVHDQLSGYAAAAERAFVRALDGGCSSPIAAYARINENQICLTGLYYQDQTDTYITGQKTAETSQAEALGKELAAELKEKLEKGGK